MTKIVTHDSSFHADDVFAVAVLLLVVTDAKIVRSRDQAEIDSADYVVDVGMIYDPSGNKFDHHQPGGAGERTNGVPYASFGLVWKKFGEKLSGGKRQAEIIENKLVQAIDGFDNGVATEKDLFKDVRSYTIGDFFNSYLTDQEDNPDDLYRIFLNNVEIAKGILGREIIRAKNEVEAENIFNELYEHSQDKRVIEVPKENLGWLHIATKYPELLYIVYPRQNGTWGIKAVPDENKPHGYQRKKLPVEWAGKRDEEFQKITGVSDAIFAHKALFTAGAKSREGALKLAEIALNS
ncbi:MAG: MYG1 family protein [Candidatus Zambryskibacteria bacterium]|nr:MYG1 family protein [Candidatus Zambryskibacteria bacterium]